MRFVCSSSSDNDNVENSFFWLVPVKDKLSWDIVANKLDNLNEVFSLQSRKFFNKNIGIDFF